MHDLGIYQLLLQHLLTSDFEISVGCFNIKRTELRIFYFLSL